MARKGATMDKRPAIDRYWDRTIRPAIGEPQHGCWRWTGPTTHDGYGQISVNGRTMVAHQFAYITFVGPVPEGKQLDHSCRHRWCVNPHHLEPVTSAVNTMRGESFSAQNARKTHCPQGHPYDVANTYRFGPGMRYRACRTCRGQRHAAGKVKAA